MSDTPDTAEELIEMARMTYTGEVSFAAFAVRVREVFEEQHTEDEHEPEKH